MTRILKGFAAALLLALATSNTAMAEDAMTNDTTATESLLGVEPESDQILEAANGREGLSLNAADLESVHGFNEANGARSGSASIGAGALSNFSGQSAVVMNTGHNAVVQVSQQIIFNLY